MTISTNTYILEITHEELRVIEGVFNLMNDYNLSDNENLGATVVGTYSDVFNRLKEQFSEMRWGGAKLHKSVNGTYRD